MRVTFYTAVLVVAAGSVIFGLDWVSAPMPPMPESKNIVFAPPPPPPPPRVAAPAPVATPPAPQAAPVPQAPAAPAARAPTPAQASAPSPVQSPVAVPPAVAAPRIKCDVDACAAAYRSFRESDCTYNPSFGPRRLCTKGDPERYAREHPEVATPAAAPAAPPVATAPVATPAPEAPPAAQTSESGSSNTPSILAPEPGAAAATPAAAPPRCNVAACAAAYPRSFREGDCTFNPSSGPRKLCER